MKPVLKFFLFFPFSFFLPFLSYLLRWGVDGSVAGVERWVCEKGCHKTRVVGKRATKLGMGKKAINYGPVS